MIRRYLSVVTSSEHGPRSRSGSRTVPTAIANVQVNDSVDLGEHNQNHFPTTAGAIIDLP